MFLPRGCVSRGRGLRGTMPGPGRSSAFMPRPKPLLIAVIAAVAALPACGSPPPPSRAASSPPAPVSDVPAGLSARLDIVAEAFGGPVGIAVRDVAGGWTASVDGARAYPQQSVSKLWVAVALLDAVDRGEVRLDEPVTVRREDLSVFHQPIRAGVAASGVLSTTVEALLRGALIQSDNAANDVLIRRLGGPEAVQAVLTRKGVEGVRLGDEERDLQARIAGLVWRPDHAFGRTFWTERELVPRPTREALLNAYIADPPDGATPSATVEALARLQRGELLSPASTERLITILREVETGPSRLKAGLSEGWTLAHKTGTGQVLGARQTGFNDVGLMTAPDGRVYAVAVFIAETTRPVPERQALMAEVARAVVAHHEIRAGVLPPITSRATPGRR